MAKSKRKRTSLSSGRWIFTVIVAALLIAVAVVLKNIIALHLEQRELKKQEEALQNSKDELTAELQSIDDLDYIEEQARKLLRMIKPGEILYVLNGNDPRPEHNESEETVIPEPEPQVTYEEDTYDYSENTYDEYDYSYDSGEDYSGGYSDYDESGTYVGDWTDDAYGTDEGYYDGAQDYSDGGE